METLLLHQRKEEKYSSSNQEEGFINPKLLRLGSPIPTPTLTDQESPIMFSDSCSMCGSKKRRCLTPSFGQRKKTILIDPSSMKEAAAAAASSIDHERSHSRPSSSFLHQIPNSSPPQTSPFLNRSVSDISSFALSGSFSSPKSPEKAAATPNQTSSCPSNAAYLGRSSSFPSSFDSLKTSSPFSSPKSPENAAVTPNQKSNPSNSSYFGRSNSFSSCFDSPSSSSPCFHLPKSSSTATPPTTDSVQKSDDQKPIGDQKSIGDQKDCSRGNCKVGVLAATTTSTSTTDHPKHEQIEEGNIKKVQFSCSCGKHYQVQFFG